ncbi:MAG: gluconate 2-dehydrogenase subunit 3 family protein [Opitutaceae bacterium]
MSIPASFPRSTLQALLDRIIPDDDFPGAIRADVETYLLRQLLGDCALEKEELTRGLLSLEAEANHQTGLSFAALTPDRRDALLHAIEAGLVSTSWSSTLPAAAFFLRMVDLAHEGFYADPGNGGNRGGVSWRMIGYDPRLPQNSR